MKLAIVGTGYVGLVSAACLAELGHEVICVDIDPEKIRILSSGKSTIYEPGLEDLLVRNRESGRLSFTTDLLSVLNTVQVVFSAVATPEGENHAADLHAVFAVAQSIAEHATKDLIFVNKSTVPVGTAKKCEERMADILRKRGVSFSIPVVSNPEFLREGMAVNDTLMPDRVVVGIDGDVRNHHVKTVMEELYRPITRVGRPLLFMNRESAEIVKYASNSYLATRISFINMLTQFTEKTGGNIRHISAALGLDHRIGQKFLHAGIGYGGSCFPKDVKAFLSTAKEYGVSFDIVEATDRINANQRRRFFDRILSVLPKKGRVCLWGLSFKPRTDDIREAPSLDLIRLLIKNKHTIAAYDPFAMEHVRKLFPESILYAQKPLEAAEGADAIALLTEWDVFRGLDLTSVRGVMRGCHFFDGRNIYEPAQATAAGLTYYGVGMG